MITELCNVLDLVVSVTDLYKQCHLLSTAMFRESESVKHTDMEKALSYLTVAKQLADICSSLNKAADNLFKVQEMMRAMPISSAINTAA